MDRKVDSRFLTLAARMLRRVQVEQARSRVPLAATRGRNPDLLALDAALDELGKDHARAVSVVELRFFAGLGGEETARVLHVSTHAVEMDWRYARAWLNRELSRGRPPA